MSLPLQFGHLFYNGICLRYGSEIDCSRLCPDFPVNSGGDRYSKSLWNLSRLRDATLLRHLPQPISGVTQPWVYVGMCFSSFCWHNEDMHLYSINYLHEGDEKIWYQKTLPRCIFVTIDAGTVQAATTLKSLRRRLPACFHSS